MAIAIRLEFVDNSGRLQELQNEGLRERFPDIYTQIIRSCGDRKDLAEGKRIHEQIFRSEHRQNRYLGNLLIQMYGKCGSMQDARNVFDSLCQPNVFSWTIVIAAYARNGQCEEAKEMFDMMPRKDVVSWNSVIALYAQKGQLQEARKMFDSMPRRDIVSWNTMITAYAQNGHLREARKLFDEMPERDVVSWNATMTAYAQSGYLQEARRMFDEIPELNVVTWNALITAFMHVGDFQGAKAIFDRMPHQDVISCTAMITGHSQTGELEQARKMFEEMPEKDSVAWNSMVAAYAQNGDFQEARSMLERMPQKDTVSWNAMITAYAQNGHMEEASSMFDKMPKHNIVSWSAIIAGYAQNGQGREAITLFKRMDLEGVRPNEVTFVSVLDACASITALSEGRLVHEDIVAEGWPLNVVIGNALLDMYGKCGRVKAARSVFDRMPQRDEIAWTAMIAAYAHVRISAEALELVHLMALEGVQPNEITLVGILSACSHEGLLANARNHFRSLVGEHGVGVIMDHYKCMVDILGRAGRLRDAEELIHSMPFEPDVVSWVTLLSACRVNGDVDQAARASQSILELDPKNESSFILLSHMYASQDASC